jgi:hypothetical protein
MVYCSHHSTRFPPVFLLGCMKRRKVNKILTMDTIHIALSSRATSQLHQHLTPFTSSTVPKNPKIRSKGIFIPHHLVSVIIYMIHDSISTSSFHPIPSWFMSLNVRNERHQKKDTISSHPRFVSFNAKPSIINGGGIMPALALSLLPLSKNQKCTQKQKTKLHRSITDSSA